MKSMIGNSQDQVHTFASHFEELAATSEEINDQAQQAFEDDEKMNEVTDLIRTISRQTNLLSINASIEAARAGQHEAGFNIMAEEVWKLSIETSNEQAELLQSDIEIIEELNVLSEEMKEFMQRALK